MSNLPEESYFNCNMSFDGSSEPADENDYDRHNEETFGENLLNWEEGYEKVSSDLEKVSIDYENNKLSERVASVILDDEGDDPLRPTRTSSSVSTVPLWDVNRSSKPHRPLGVFLFHTNSIWKDHSGDQLDTNCQRPAINPSAGDSSSQPFVTRTPSVLFPSSQIRNPNVPVFPRQNPNIPVYPGQNSNVPVFPGQNPNIPVYPEQNPNVPVFPIQNPNVPFFPGQTPNVPVFPGQNPNIPFFPGQNPNIPVFPGQNPNISVFPGQLEPQGWMSPPFISSFFSIVWTAHLISHHIHQVNENLPTNPGQVFTVAEVEAKMRREAEVQNDSAAVREHPANVQNRGAINRTANTPRTPNNATQNSRYHHNEGVHDRFQPRYPPYFPPRQHAPQGIHPCPPQQRHLGQMNNRPFFDPRQNHPRMRRPYPNAPLGNHQNNHHHLPGPHQPTERFPSYFNQQQRGFNMPASSQPVDEYAGLMSPQEKQWLQSIQAMQLSGNQPIQDDYYFFMYNQNKQGNMSRKLGSFNVPREVSKPSSTYTPQQFENSLGKLQIGSVTAPRKIIDMEVVETPNIDANAKPPEKKSKQQLIEIEEMYPVILEMEEACNPLFNPTNSAADLSQHQEKVLNFLLSDNKLISVMSIRKGKRLVFRSLPLLSNPAPLVHKLLLDLVPIARKDGAEQLLLTFLPAIRTYLGTVALSTLVEISKRYETNFMFSTKFTTSVMANIVERAEQVYGMCQEEHVREEWVEELTRLAESVDHWVEENRPVVAIDRQLLVQHLILIDKKVHNNQITGLLRALGSLRPNNSPLVHA